ncbi:MAG TPA: sigma 54-interacting transcriptional regulator [Symbiobacteriaceae bacterium]|nr:sigma 54-interacting transcriptional regulator [Symbiobacteriaceae bacterium]
MELWLVAVSQVMTRRFTCLEGNHWPDPATLQESEPIVYTEGGRLCGAANGEQVLHWLRRYPAAEPAGFPWPPVGQVRESLTLADALKQMGPSITIVTDEHANVVGVLRWVDIARCLREEYVRLHAQFQTALNTVEESVSMINEEGRVVAWNRAAHRLFDIPPSSIIGRPLSEFFPLKDQWSLRALSSGVSVHRSLHEPRPGTWVIINSAPIKVGEKIIGALAVEQNVTDVVHLNEQLYRTTSTVKALQGEVARLRQNQDPFASINGNGPAIQGAISLARKVAQSDVTVLIRGESGVGKELFAQAIHDASERRDKPFVAINCGAIPQALFESELFGYEKGAFTGADQKGKSGKLEQAQGGSLFLDEVAELPLETQVKLLRVLQDRRFYRLGSDKPRQADVRIVAATNRNLEEMMRTGAFREDLYFRLDVVSLEIPPLRRRLDDIAELVHSFAQEFAVRYQRPIQGIEPEVMMALVRYPWPGNIRELRNVMERVVVLTDDGMVRAGQLPAHIRQASAVEAPPAVPAALPVPAAVAAAAAVVAQPRAEPSRPELNLSSTAKEARRKAILAALEACDGNRSLAAEYLGISRSALYYQMRRLGIE